MTPYIYLILGSVVKRSHNMAQLALAKNAEVDTISMEKEAAASYQDDLKYRMSGLDASEISFLRSVTPEQRKKIYHKVLIEAEPFMGSNAHRT